MRRVATRSETFSLVSKVLAFRLETEIKICQRKPLFTWMVHICRLNVS